LFYCGCRNRRREFANTVPYDFDALYGQVRLSRYDVLHIPGLGFDGLVGYSPIAMAKNAVGISLACE